VQFGGNRHKQSQRDRDQGFHVSTSSRLKSFPSSDSPHRDLRFDAFGLGLL
jgi:hypothetical protein